MEPMPRRMAPRRWKSRVFESWNSADQHVLQRVEYNHGPVIQRYVSYHADENTANSRFLCVTHEHRDVHRP